MTGYACLGRGGGIKDGMTLPRAWRWAREKQPRVCEEREGHPHPTGATTTTKDPPSRPSVPAFAGGA